MNIRLAENIKTFRRKRKMTQEQLAEALGVTVGAVYKWESRASMPEIRLLLEMADLFSISVDSLLGYEMQSSAVDDIIDRIKDYLRAKDFDSALTEAEKALLRYPNSFKIVSCCFDAYERKGIETADKHALERAIELMEHSILLLPQNENPEISEVTIRSDIATCYIKLGQMDKGIEILKKYNAGGINNSLIGLTYTISKEHKAEDAELYLMKAFADSISTLIRCMSGYLNYYDKKGDFTAAMDAALWAIHFLRSIKTSDDEICYLDKVISVTYAAYACFADHLGSAGEAERYLSEAFEIAEKFDASPVYSAHAIRFCIGSTEKTTVSDDIGTTAMEGIENLIVQDKWNNNLRDMWKRIKSRQNNS